MEDKIRLITLKHLIFSVLALVEPLLSVRLNADEYGLLFVDSAIVRINACVRELTTTYNSYRCDFCSLETFTLNLSFVDKRLDHIGRTLVRNKALCVTECDPYNQLESVTNSLLKCRHTLQSIISIDEDTRPQE